MKFRSTLAQLRAFDPPAALRDTTRPLLNLALNENSLGSSPAVAAAVAAALPQLHRYPPTFSDALRQALARRHGVGADRFLVGNGIFELLGLITQAFVAEGDEVVIPTPSFGWYAISARAAGARIVAVPLAAHAIDLDAVAAAVTPATRLVWLCNPHNPMGSLVAAGAIRRLLERLPADVAVVLDEAYAEYARPADLPDSAHWIDEHPNLIVLRTFSKAFGLAGLRVGYAIASPPAVRELGKLKSPPNVNSLAQVAALAALGDEDFLRRSVATVHEAARAYAGFCAARGLGYVPTHANFVMIDLGQDGDAAAAEFLRQGIVIRSGSEIGLPSWIRVTLGLEHENARVFELIDTLLAARRDGAAH